MNKPDEKKRKVTYFEHKGVYATLEQIAGDETKIQPYAVSVPEIIRTLTLARANGYLRKHGQKQIDYDPSAGKFAPANAASPANAFVNMRGGLKVFDKLGNQIKRWSKVIQIPELLRLYPKCRIEYDPTDILRYL